MENLHFIGSYCIMITYDTVLKRLVLPSSGPSPYYMTILLPSGNNCVYSIHIQMSPIGNGML